jgi:hypothetical protein
MKKTIDGIRYNSETAVKVIDLMNPDPTVSGPEDDRYWEATLYATKISKKYFLVGSGGPMTRFAQDEGRHVWSAGAALIPLSGEDAQRVISQNQQWTAALLGDEAGQGNTESE